MNEVLEPVLLMGSIPWYGWFLIIIVVMFIFGDSVIWDYEVKFPLVPGLGRGKIEFECLKKKGIIIEAKFSLETDYLNEDIQIFLKGEHVYTIPSQKNITERIFVKENIEIEKPTEGDEVTVQIRDEIVFRGPLVLD